MLECKGSIGTTLKGHPTSRAPCRTGWGPLNSLCHSASPSPSCSPSAGGVALGSPPQGTSGKPSFRVIFPRTRPVIPELCLPLPLKASCNFFMLIIFQQEYTFIDSICYQLLSALPSKAQLASGTHEGSSDELSNSEHHGKACAPTGHRAPH